MFIFAFILDFRHSRKMPLNFLDPEKYRGKYVSSDGKIIYFDWRLHFNDVYEFSGNI